MKHRRPNATARRNPAPSSPQVSKAMAANRGVGNALERGFLNALKNARITGFKANHKVDGIRPDLVFLQKKVAVFLHGCFWHRCPECALPLPKRNRDFWQAKFRANRRRDRLKRDALESLGWLVKEYWAHEILPDATKTIARLRMTLEQRLER